MNLSSITRMRPLTRATLIAIAMVAMAARPAAEERPPAADSGTKGRALAPAQAVELAPAQLIEPADLARLLSDTSSRPPTILHVGDPLLFRAGHIAGSRHIGPASTPEGLQSLKQALRDIPRHHTIVLYCGCCPWVDCPNVRPALHLAQELGRSEVKLLHLPRNLQRDWIDQGLPVGRGDR